MKWTQCSVHSAKKPDLQPNKPVEKKKRKKEKINKERKKRKEKKRKEKKRTDKKRKEKKRKKERKKDRKKEETKTKENIEKGRLGAEGQILARSKTGTSRAGDDIAGIGATWIYNPTSL